MDMGAAFQQSREAQRALGIGRRGGRLALSIAAVAAALGLIAEAYAESQAVLNAVAFRPVPTDEAIFVRTLDNSEESERLRRRFERLLSANGHEINQGAARLVLTIESTDQPGFWSYQPGALISADRGYDRRARKDLDAYRVKFYDSVRGGLVNEPERPTDVSATRYRLEARLEDRDNGRTLWQGWMVAPRTAGRRMSLWIAMVPALADTVGQTVRERPVPLP